MTIRATSATPGDQPPLALDPAVVAVTLDAAGSEDAIEAIIAAKTAAVEQIAGGALWHRDYQERRHGSNTSRLYLQARPLTAVASIRLGDDGGAVDPECYELWDSLIFYKACAKWVQYWMGFSSQRYRHCHATR